MKPKLLLFSDWFYPGFKAGGPIKSVTNLSIALQNDFEVFVFTSNTDLNEIKPYPNIQSNIWIKPIDGSNVNVYYCSKDKLNNAKIKAIIKEVSPTSIYLNHLWSFRFVLQPLFICWLFFRQIKIVLCPRGALFESALHYLNTYPKKRIVISILKMLGIHKKIHFHATTLQEKQTIEKYFGNVNISIANNLPDLQQPTLSTIEKKVGVLKLVFIARILEIKNLKFLLQNLQNVISKIDVTIAGPIEDKNYWETCLETINTLPTNIIVNYLGEITPSQVMPLIQQNHLYCLPTQGENFGHSIFESFMIGRPVLISNKTPWLNLNTKKAGWDVNIIEQNSFETFIEEAANWQQDTFNAYCNGAWKVANEYINNPTLVPTYFPIFNN